MYKQMNLDINPIGLFIVTTVLVCNLLTWPDDAFITLDELRFLCIWFGLLRWQKESAPYPNREAFALPNMIDLI
jgi:hypothetical protein